jgi:predicted PurR-regulated permease PerM
MTFNLTLYFSMVYLLVASETAALDYVLGFIPESGNMRQGITNSLSSKLDGIFTCSLEGALYQAIWTYLIFDFSSVKYVYLYCLAAAFFKTVPFVSTSLVGVSGAV